MAVFNVEFYANSLGRTVPVVVILPTDKFYFPWMKKREDKPYKTLYLLHGIVGSCTDWLYGSRIKLWAEENDLCVVMPSGENSMYLDQGIDYYGEYIGKELIEFTRKTFPLSDKKEDTFIGGLSMGGFGAMRNGLKYSDTFGSIISLSGAFVLNEKTLEDVENPMFPADTMTYKKRTYGEDLAAALVSDKNPLWLIEQMAKEGKEFPEIYMACGTEDFLLAENERVHKLLTDCGVKHEFITGPGGHEWPFWDAHLKEALDWLPLEKGEAGKGSGNIGK